MFSGFGGFLDSIPQHPERLEPDLAVSNLNAKLCSQAAGSNCLLDIHPSILSSNPWQVSE